MTKTEAPAASAEAVGQKQKFNVNMKNKRQRKATFQLWDQVQRKASGQDEHELTTEEVTKLMETVIGPKGARLTGAELSKRLQLQASSRALQSVLKVCSGDDVEEARVELRDAVYQAVVCDEDSEAKVFLSTCNNKFGWVLVTKMLRDIPEAFDDLMDRIISLSHDLVLSKKGSLVWECAYNHIIELKGKYAKKNEKKPELPSEKEKLLRRLISAAILPRQVTAIKTEAKELPLDKSMSEVFSEKERAQVMKHMSEMIDKMIDKRLFQPIGLALITTEYLKFCDEEERANLVKRYLVCGDKDRAVFAEVLKLLHSMVGLELFSALYGHLTTKDRRALNVIIKSNEAHELLRRMFTTEGVGSTNKEAWLALLRIVSVLDDTKASTDLVKAAMKGGCVHEARAGESEARPEDCQMRKFILGNDLNPKRGNFVAPRGQCFLLKAMTLKELTDGVKKTNHSNLKHLAILNLDSPASKKDMLTRSQEMRKNLSKLGSDFFVAHFKANDDAVIKAAFGGELRDLIAEVLVGRSEVEDFTLLDTYVLPMIGSDECKFEFFGRNRVVRALVTIAVSRPEKADTIFANLFSSRLNKAVTTDLIWPLVSLCESMQKEETKFPNLSNILNQIQTEVDKLADPFPNMKRKGEMNLAALLKESRKKKRSAPASPEAPSSKKQKKKK